MIYEIVILAMIAAFLGLRLYSVLGRRAEHEEEPIPNRFDAGDAAKTPKPVLPPGQQTVRPQRELAGYPPATERGVREIAAADQQSRQQEKEHALAHAHRGAQTLLGHSDLSLWASLSRPAR